MLMFPLKNLARKGLTYYPVNTMAADMKSQGIRVSVAT